jgi:predicted Zn-dependent protease
LKQDLILSFYQKSNHKFFMKRIVFFVIFCFFLSCTKVPISGRRQLNLISELDLIQMSSQQYLKFINQSHVIRNTYEAKLIEKVGKNISEAVERYLLRNNQQKRVEGFDWEFKLIDDDLVNAWCMPGGKICFYSGILKYTQDENGLAVVMGHEIAHAIARHGNERMSKALAVQMGGVALSVAVMNQGTEIQEIFQEAYGISSGLSGLAFSRRNEIESDKLGLVFMELAGYDANYASDFWERMSKSSQHSPAFLSTHPSDEKRIEEINSFLVSDKFSKHIHR